MTSLHAYIQIPACIRTLRGVMTFPNEEKSNEENNNARTHESTHVH